MNTRLIATLVASVFVLTACAGNSGGSLPGSSNASGLSTSATSSRNAGLTAPAQLQARGISLPLHPPASPNTDRRGSWMMHGASGSTLLYVADEATNDVYVYSYPAGKLVGTLTGFNTPTGMCSDRAGDVYVLNGNAYTVTVYAHGGTSPIRTLSLPGYPELSCSVNPKTGDFAVGSFDGSCGECAGYIAVFTGGQGTPTLFQPSAQIGIPGCGYDALGNLYCDAYSNRNRTFTLFKLPAGGKNVKTVSLSGTLPKGGPLQWDGKELAVASAAGPNLVQISVKGTTGTIGNTTTLSGAGWVWQFWINGGGWRAIVPTYAGSDGAIAGYWNYPAGGNATQQIAGFSQPDGATLSI